MNIKQFLHLLIGLFIIVAGACLAYKWEKEFLVFIKGAIPIVLVVFGILWGLIGYLLAEDIE
jgi:hypothetical protein